MLAAGYGLGVLLAGAQILPTLDLARISWQHRSASAGYQDTWSLTRFSTWSELLPDFFGRNGQDTYWGMAHYWEECSYVGSAALALAVIGLVSRHRLARFYGGYLRSSRPGWRWGRTVWRSRCCDRCPLLAPCDFPARYMFLFDLSVAVLAGCGVHWLSCLHRRQEWSRARWMQGVAGWTLGVAATFLTVWWFSPGRLRDVMGRLGPAHRFHAPDVTPLLLRYELSSFGWTWCSCSGDLLWSWDCSGWLPGPPLPDG